MTSMLVLSRGILEYCQVLGINYLVIKIFSISFSQIMKFILFLSIRTFLLKTSTLKIIKTKRFSSLFLSLSFLFSIVCVHPRDQFPLMTCFRDIKAQK